MSQVRRIYVEKKVPYAVRAKELKHEIQSYLGIQTLESVRILMRYDIENISDAIFEMAKKTIFSEPTLDYLYEEVFESDNEDCIFTVSYLPGQFDQRADSANQCIRLLKEDEEAMVQFATTYVFKGILSNEEIEKIKKYCVNPVDSHIVSEEKPKTLEEHYEEPLDVSILTGFITMEEEAFCELFQSLNLAMTLEDFACIKAYFVEENRNPSMTEIRMLDTYWSDHCRHTTFLTELKDVSFEDGYYMEPIKKSYESYQTVRNELKQDEKGKYPSLMNLALIAMKKLKEDGKLADMEESDEINACSIVVPVEIDGKEEEWLVFFKNETHNHPTEIEPFGGAATCLGGAIRDPLSGRGYVYQAMRITGAADPRVPLNETLEGKLPQKKIVKGAASGYSSYGNQIGLATGLVREIYHPNYVAKRMEIGAVLGAAPRKNVIREDSLPGNQIILIGGRTGRDGCGGATGSSKAHTSDSIHQCGAEVQKGNPPTERKIQRLFRREEVSSLIKKCNDFGAGGVSVAIGELADGLMIQLDLVPKKYAGLDGTELAISESQERMAVVVEKKDVDAMLAFAAEENLEAVVVAEVTKEPRLVMKWKEKEIVNIKRSFLDTNGAHQENDVFVSAPKKDNFAWNKMEKVSFKENWLKILQDLNVCSQKGLMEMFDSSIGAGTVTMPFGGKYQLTPIQTMIAKLPVLKGNCDTVTMMSYGFDPYLSTWSPYHGSVYAILSSVAKIVASGGDYRKIHFTFQEYFKRLGKDSKRFGEPMAALLGAYEAQIKLGLASIGGKDSMSGTFQDIDVPPTLCSFAVNTGKLEDVITPELKEVGNVIVAFPIKMDAYDLPEYDSVLELYQRIYQYNEAGIIRSAYAVGYGGIAEAVSMMAFGNQFGVALLDTLKASEYFASNYGMIVAEMKEEAFATIKEENATCFVVGKITDKRSFQYGEEIIPMEDAILAWKQSLEEVYPTKTKEDHTIFETNEYQVQKIYTCKEKHTKPKVFIPVFPGTNCEYDSIRAFEEAGGEVSSLVFRNQSANDIKESVAAYVKEIKKSQIIMLPGGFSAGDEPDGSAKFIASVFRNPYLVEAVNDLLKQRDGLMLGICNGFQALIKLGLVPFGEILECKEEFPTLSTNVIGRHISKIVQTKVISNQSPWLRKVEVGEVHSIPISHGEGRFIATDEMLHHLFENGQVATQYVDFSKNPTMEEEFNPNGSFCAIEGITSKDGRVLGKMGHSERKGYGVSKNIQGNQNQYLFESGISYFQ